MRNLIKETFKLVILFIIIGIGTVFVIQISEPVAAPTALAEDIRQYGVFLDDPTNGDYKSFADWQTKKTFKLTISQLEQ